MTAIAKAAMTTEDDETGVVAAQEGWAATAPREPGGEILRRAFELMSARADELALLMTLEMGKPWWSPAVR
jgi:acyl-CoA reductase-like NAD-dependent aldehyde dehydrogenase